MLQKMLLVSPSYLTKFCKKPSVDKKKPAVKKKPVDSYKEWVKLREKQDPVFRKKIQPIGGPVKEKKHHHRHRRGRRKKRKSARRVLVYSPESRQLPFLTGPEEVFEGETPPAATSTPKPRQLDSGSDVDSSEEEVFAPPTPKEEVTHIENRSRKVLGDVAGRYLAPYLHSPRATDNVFGIYKDKRANDFKIGNSKIEIDNNKLLLHDRWYKPSVGLWELLSRKNVDKNLVTKKDLETYKEILKLTNGHLQNHESFGKIKSSRGKKYKEIIAPLFPSKANEEPVASTSRGWTTYSQKK